MRIAWDMLKGTGAEAHPAESVTLIYGSGDEKISGVMVYVDREAGLVHVLDHLGETHLYTTPTGRTIIEWRHSSERAGERIASRSSDTGD